MSRTRSASSAIGAVLLFAFSTNVRAAEPRHDDQSEKVDEITVTATPLAHTSDELAVPVLVIDRDHILSHIGTTLGETLGAEPGVTNSGFAPGASRPVLRGQDSFRVRILEDGIGTHDVSAISADHGVPVNPLLMQRIEVVRGPAALRYGGGAVGGVVNAITGRVPDRLGEKPLAGEFYTGYATGARDLDGAFLLEGTLGQMAWHIDGVRRDTDDFNIPDRRDSKQRFTDTDASSISIGAAWIGERARLGLGADRFSNVYGIPDPEDPTEPASIDLDKDALRLEFDLDAPMPGIESLSLRAGRSFYEHDEIVLGVAGSTFENDEWEGSLEVLHGEVLGFNGALGAHLRQKDLRASGEASELLSPTHTDSLAFYVFEEREIGSALHLEVGGRFEDVETSGTPFVGARRTRSFHPLAGSIALVANPHPTTSIGLTAAVTQRAPEALELFAKGPHEADETFQIGDPTFDPETARTLDLTLRSEWGSAEFEISGFYSDYRNFTFGRVTGNTRDEDGTFFVGAGGELTEVIYTQSDAKFLGGEVHGSVDVADFDLPGIGATTLGLDAQGDLVRARLNSGNVPRIPPARWGGGISLRGDRFRTRVGFLRAEEQDRLADAETKTDAYTMVDAVATIRVLERDDREIDLILVLRNATDERGRNHVSLKKEGVLLPGRSFRVGLQARF